MRARLARQSSLYRPLHVDDSRLARVRAPHPLERLAKETVTFPARNDVDVEVRYALGDADIDRDERAVRVHPALNGQCQVLHVQEQWTNLVRRQVAEGLIVGPRDDQHVAGQDRPVIEKGNCRVVLEDVIGRYQPGDDVAEDTAPHRR